MMQPIWTPIYFAEPYANLTPFAYSVSPVGHRLDLDRLRRWRRYRQHAGGHRADDHRADGGRHADADNNAGHDTDNDACHDANDDNPCHDANDNACHDANDNDACHDANDNNACHDAGSRHPVGPCSH